ncbi:hypothetical protein KY290_027683 [Solanum tuberosum]|uniref:DUF4283 domain-containing protein n=1 Tax=Solanum tuberosum TaxID=4113 RepID=A0ABQ7UFQ5_SOLTU|nr:hypothetical protein KY290_027683 [Solanum tuberosum]
MPQMGRGRPQRANQRYHEEEIHHRIASRSATGQLTKSETIEENLLGSNGTLTQGKSTSKTQKRLEFSGEEVKKPWVDVFATNRLATRAQDDEKWAPSIVVYVVGTTPTIGAMERFIMGQERDKVLCSGPHHLLRRPVIMKPWVPEFNFKEEILITIPVWIKLPNLPLNCWNSIVLSKIGSSLGKPLYADECTTQVSRISFARILVEVDVTRPLPKVEENQQEQTTKDNDGTTQGQGELQTVRHRTSSRRDYRNIQGERGGQGPTAGVMTYEEGKMIGEGSGEMKRPSIQLSIHDSNMECEGL